MRVLSLLVDPLSSPCTSIRSGTASSRCPTHCMVAVPMTCTTWHAYMCCRLKCAAYCLVHTPECVFCALPCLQAYGPGVLNKVKIETVDSFQVRGCTAVDVCVGQQPTTHSCMTVMLLVLYAASSWFDSVIDTRTCSHPNASSFTACALVYGCVVCACGHTHHVYTHLSTCTVLASGCVPHKQQNKGSLPAGQAAGRDDCVPCTYNQRKHTSHCSGRQARRRLCGRCAAHERCHHSGQARAVGAGPVCSTAGGRRAGRACANGIANTR